MQIKKNLTMLRGKVTQVEPAADGLGANVKITVENVSPADGMESAIQASPGSTVEVFTPEIGDLKPGQDRKMAITVLGGPQGTRKVIQELE